MGRHTLSLDDIDADVLRGVGDGGAAIQEAIDSMPDVRITNPDGTTRSDVGDLGWDSSSSSALFIPSNFEGKQVEIDFTTQVVFPARKNVRIYSDAPWGPRLINSIGGGENHMFSVPHATTGRMIQFDGISFDQGGIHVEASNRGFIGVKNSIFQRTGGPAIHLEDGTGVGVVGFYAENNYFVECAGGVWGESSTNVVSHLKRNRYLYSTDCPVILNGPGWYLEQEDFQLLSEAYAIQDGSAFVWLPDGANGAGAGQHDSSLIWIRGGRMGSESGNNYNGAIQYPPTQSILTGDPTTPDAQSTVTMQINDVQFLGAATPHATNTNPGKFGITFANRPISCEFGGGNVCRNYSGSFMNELYADTGLPSGRTWGPQRERNLFLMQGFTSAGRGSRDLAVGVPWFGPSPNPSVPTEQPGYEWRTPFLTNSGYEFTGPDGSLFSITMNNNGAQTTTTIFDHTP